MTQQPTSVFPLTRHVYWSMPDAARDRPILGAVVGKRSTLLVDAGASPAHGLEFVSSLKTLSGSPLRYLAITHWHWDHVFGIAALNLPTIAQREAYSRIAGMAKLGWSDRELDSRVSVGETSAFMADHMKMEMTNEQRESLLIATPDLLFDHFLQVDLGGITCQVVHVGGDHSPDCSVVYVPDEKVLFLGDCFYSGSSKTGGYFTLPKLFPLLETLLAFGADYYLPAHHEEPLTGDEFRKECEVLRRIGELVDQVGPDRNLAQSRLAEALGGPIDQDHLYYLEYLDAFLCGLEQGIS